MSKESKSSRQAPPSPLTPPSKPSTTSSTSDAEAQFQAELDALPVAAPAALPPEIQEELDQLRKFRGDFEGVVMPLLEIREAQTKAAAADVRMSWEVVLMQGEKEVLHAVRGVTTLPGLMKKNGDTADTVLREVTDKIGNPLAAFFQQIENERNFPEVPGISPGLLAAPVWDDLDEEDIPDSLENVPEA